MGFVLSIPGRVVATLRSLTFQDVITVAGAFLLGNAYRCGVPDHRVVRAGKVIRELIVAAADDASEQTAAKSRFTEIFRESARAEGNGRTPIPPCHTVVSQFERLEQFHDQTGRR